MPAPAGHRKWGGRKKGTPNKVNKALKDMILGALEDAGGQKYLVAQAKKNPNAFMTLVGKVLPMQHTGEGGGPMRVEFISALEKVMNSDRGGVEDIGFGD